MQGFRTVFETRCEFVAIFLQKLRNYVIMASLCKKMEFQSNEICNKNWSNICTIIANVNRPVQIFLKVMQLILISLLFINFPNPLFNKRNTYHIMSVNEMKL